VGAVSYYVPPPYLLDIFLINLVEIEARANPSLLLGLAFLPAEHWERFLQLLLGFDGAERISDDVRWVKRRRGRAGRKVFERQMP
jgi:hypothetical protein